MTYLHARTDGQDAGTNTNFCGCQTAFQEQTNRKKGFAAQHASMREAQRKTFLEPLLFGEIAILARPRVTTRVLTPIAAPPRTSVHTIARLMIKPQSWCRNELCWACSSSALPPSTTAALH